MRSINIVPMGILSAMLFSACSNEPGEVLTNNAHTMAKYKSFSTIAANKANPYDYVGNTYRTTLAAYKSGNHQPSSFAEIDSIVHVLMHNHTIPDADSKQHLLSSCVNDPEGTLIEILSASELSATAKVVLSEFIENFETLSNLPFNEAYINIVGLENDVLASPVMTSYDQRVILTVAAISRYSLYHSCCEDTDWGKSVGNIVAATAGAIQGEIPAIEYILITSIADVEKIQM